MKINFFLLLLAFVFSPLTPLSSNNIARLALPRAIFIKQIVISIVRSRVKNTVLVIKNQNLFS